ncbi:MAG: hypothetical protein FGF48_01635 [Candidatus Brockarchaeota archaeon]|nr:hypothetical protein [Candidatus Brockarchaeota archaeon]
MIQELRKKFTDSIEYLRKMSFFQDYSELSSEEIFNEILKGEITYAYWWEEWERRKPRLRGPLHHIMEGYEEELMKASDASIDYIIIPFDTKRTVTEDYETWLGKGLGITMLKRYAKISRGVFQPKDIEEECSFPNFDPELGKEWFSYKVYFIFMNERHYTKIILWHDFFEDLGLKKINELIKDTGYQYYRIDHELVMVVVLTEEEAKKLMKERNWRFRPV